MLVKSIPTLNPGGILSKSIKKTDETRVGINTEKDKQTQESLSFTPRIKITFFKVYILLQFRFLLDLVQTELLHSSCKYMKAITHREISNHSILLITYIHICSTWKEGVVSVTSS